jgi:hypothetical protein
MALWRCAHCGTPQPVAARCWVCRRSSTSCATCRHFRSSVAARIGYCGLDKAREPLTGVEVRSCWDGRALVLEDEATRPLPVVAGDAIAPHTDELYVSGFVLVDSLPVAVATPPEPLPAEPALTPDAPGTVSAPAAPVPDGMLWSELDP